ncbi:Cadmium, zinc and cobalt-transporting ATPase [Defluviimonas aquaemixtae]|uniref:P-type Zn(2+) transporter n=1 Tax=Albidovulum aquaemixtae TaxID=1542388 RepID=A0A2R8B2H7_9RHOB|nr:heavy metal translocating P-type ATPase [Defluviimonas aquaemixtae]SPH16839.1 Cadmium, zinc and cobalt-transporting ATPase [Defluviimonas aquaemixtae]
MTGGLILLAADRDGGARIVWFAGVVPTIAALVWEIVQSLRRGEVGVDIVAALSMTAALVFGEELAAAVVAVMYAGGTFLESFAEFRARREMHALLSRVPRSATRHRDGALEEVPLDAVAPGDRLLIRQGDAVPVDGEVAGGSALLDTSALTGEPLPVRFGSGGAVMSGATNVGEAFDLLASRAAAESTYAGIVRLVEEAQRSKAPMSRMADRWSLGFLAVTLALAAMAWWASGDPVRAVAVLVVATPCPLILAVPVALVGGMSCASRFGVLIKGARVLENLARTRTVILDKTGTLTIGHPAIVEIRPADGLSEEELLALAAALDQASKHPVAQAIVAEAVARQLKLPVPSGVTEFPGQGVAGNVAGRAVKVGGLDFAGDGNAAPILDGRPGSVLVALEVDGVFAGHMVMADNLRAETGTLFAAMRHLGVERILLATGDRTDVAETIAYGLGLEAVHAELTPDQKVLLVLTERKNGPVMMVGDGVNDAPALAAADVGVAMGARGAAASAEAADVVLLVDRLDAVLGALEIAQNARDIAWQSVAAGIGLSVAGMIAAALGYISPVQGALLQEAIDVAVVLNALRSLRIRPRHV